MNSVKIIAALITFSLIAGCGKKDEKPEVKTNEQKEDLTQQVVTKPEAENRQAPKDSLNKSAGQKVTKATVKSVPDERKFLNDSKGQWAVDADASSTKANLSDDYDAGFSTIKLIGKPDVETYGENKNAWCPNPSGKQSEWFKVFFTGPVFATEVRLRQTLNPGEVKKIELIDEKGQSHIVWEGTDNSGYTKDKIQYFVTSFPKTDFKTKIIKVTISPNESGEWAEFDAAQLVGE